MQLTLDHAWPAIARCALVLCLLPAARLPAQDPPAPASSANPFAMDGSSELAGSHPHRRFADQASGNNSHERIPAMQKEFTQASGFNWTRFFKTAAETGAQLAAPRLAMTPGLREAGGSDFYRVGSAADGQAFAVGSKGVNFSTKSSGLDLHLTVRSMLPGLSHGGGESSFAGSGAENTGMGGAGMGGVGGQGSNMGGLGGAGGREGGREAGARVSLQLKF